MRLIAIRPDAEGIRELIKSSDRYMGLLYPAESNHLEPLEVLGKPNVLLVGAYEGLALAGCGAVKIVIGEDTYGEIKRVFVDEQYRGRGISKAIMFYLENHLVERRIRIARLETGIRQPEAIGLYQRLGYVERTPFGDYREDPLSVFMEKALYA